MHWVAKWPEGTRVVDSCVNAIHYLIGRFDIFGLDPERQKMLERNLVVWVPSVGYVETFKCNCVDDQHDYANVQRPQLSR